MMFGLLRSSAAAICPMLATLPSGDSNQVRYTDLNGVRFGGGASKKEPQICAGKHSRGSHASHAGRLRSCGRRFRIWRLDRSALSCRSPRSHRVGRLENTHEKVLKSPSRLDGKRSKSQSLFLSPERSSRVSPRRLPHRNA